MIRWFDFWLRSVTTSNALTLAYWTAVSREAGALMEEGRRC
ncbi:hypothetical protein [Methylobacterium oryzae]|nr:hypothetical protein [Methylobacterium oryzae]